MSEFTNRKETRVNRLYQFCLDYLQSQNKAILVKENKEFLNSIIPQDILSVLDKFVQSQMKMDELKRFVNKLLNLLYAPLKSYVALVPKENSFLDILIKDNFEMEKLLMSTKSLIKELNNKSSKFDPVEIKTQLKSKFIEIEKFKNHYLIIENILFPILEKNWEDFRCIQIMWSFHDDIRQNIKDIIIELQSNSFDLNKINGLSARILFLMLPIKFREEKILFPYILETIKEQELDKMINESIEIGFPFVNPDKIIISDYKDGLDNSLANLLSGELTIEQIHLIFNHLPVDITYVDENDVVRYFSTPKKRIFPRTKAIIGRKIYNCHPPESYNVVENIVNSFKSGEKSQADFWINFKDEMILIQYFAIRDKNNVYKGVIEVTQEISGIRKLQGEKRLLDW